MKRVYLFVIILMTMVLVAAPSRAETPDANTIMKKMKSAWGIRPLSFKVTIVVKEGERITGKMLAGAAHKSFPDGDKLLIVLLEPESVKGLSYLLHNLKNKPSEQWMYLPYINRVRKLEGLSNYESFLSTDFTYADFAMLDIQRDIHKYIGEEEIGGIKTYKIETTSKDPNYYYSKIISWIAKDTFQILRRDYYSVSNTLWKRQLFENLTVINGLQIPMRIRMMDLQHKTNTEININEVDSDMELPDEIFVPEQLKYSLKCPVWQKVCYLQEAPEKHNLPAGNK